MENKQVAEAFWRQHEEYPNFEHVKKRRLVELNYLVPRIESEKITSVLDLGCGDGALIKCLKVLTDVEKFYAMDFAYKMMNEIPAITSHYDCNYPKVLPKVDLLVFSGVMPYLFSEEIIIKNFKKFNAKLIYIKMPCSIEAEDIVINKFSEELNCNYSSIYRTISNVIRILEKEFLIESIFAMYPERLESKFGTKQMVFICKKK